MVAGVGGRRIGIKKEQREQMGRVQACGIVKTREKGASGGWGWRQKDWN